MAEPVTAHGSIVAIQGELDVDGVDQLRDAIAAEIGRGHRHLVFDLERTEHLDCAALAQLLLSLAPLRDDPDAGVVLLKPLGVVRRILDLLQFDRVIPIAPNREAALEIVHSGMPLADGWRRVR